MEKCHCCLEMCETGYDLDVYGYCQVCREICGQYGAEHCSKHASGENWGQPGQPGKAGKPQYSSDDLAVLTNLELREFLQMCLRSRDSQTVRLIRREQAARALKKLPEKVQAHVYVYDTDPPGD